jgi:hypothetical protein
VLPACDRLENQVSRRFYASYRLDDDLDAIVSDDLPGVRGPHLGSELDGARL